MIIIILTGALSLLTRLKVDEQFVAAVAGASRSAVPASNANRVS